MKLNLYLISQNQNDGYDTYDSAVVAAPDEETARRMAPDTGEIWDDPCGTWCNSADFVKVELLGKAAKNIRKGVICSSFNAG